MVFIGSFLFDVVPIPFPPAFTIMVFLQIMFGLNIWMVIGLGVAGSILGRFILTLYIPFLTGRIFKQSKTKDVEFLGKKMKEKGFAEVYNMKGGIMKWNAANKPLDKNPENQISKDMSVSDFNKKLHPINMC